MAIKKIKVSDLPDTQNFEGLYTLGLQVTDSIDEFGDPVQIKDSVKVGLEFVKTAADTATNAAMAANNAATAADVATVAANNAVTLANTATTSANTAVTAANTAIELTNTATTNANAATATTNAAVTLATEVANNSTKVGDDNYVYKYDLITKLYVKTDILVKGDKGDIGETGATGITPVRGTDYWTTADIDAVNVASKAYIDQALSATNATILSLTAKI